jgi:hypothetical protein
MRKIDTNGFATYENVTFFREGVFEYLGKEIDPNGKFGTNPNAVYKVYRPFNEISKKEFVETLNQKPIVDDHTVIGSKAGMMKPEDKNCGGVLSNVVVVGNELHGRIDIWSTKLLDKIRAGKRELSLCYNCTYLPQKGEFEGQSYDFIQSGLACGNHLALVDEARNGHDCRVMDSMYTCDAKITLTEEEDEMDLSKLSADELVEAIKGCSDECKAKVKDFLNTPTDEEIKAKEEQEKKEAEEKAKKEAEDAEAAKKAEEEAKAKEAEDKAKDAEETEKKIEAACDSAIAEFRKALALAEKISSHYTPFGIVTCDGISTEVGLAEKVCALDKAPADLKGLTGSKAVDVLTGYLSNCKAKTQGVTVASDAKPTKKSFSDFFNNL